MPVNLISWHFFIAVYSPFDVQMELRDFISQPQN
jgi:hypothetical protein